MPSKADIGGQLVDRGIAYPVGGADANRVAGGDADDDPRFRIDRLRAGDAIHIADLEDAAFLDRDRAGPAELIGIGIVGQEAPAPFDQDVTIDRMNLWERVDQTARLHDDRGVVLGAGGVEGDGAGPAQQVADAPAPRPAGKQEEADRTPPDCQLRKSSCNYPRA